MLSPPLKALPQAECRRGLILPEVTFLSIHSERTFLICHSHKVPRSIKWVCRGLVRRSSLGTFILGEGRKKEHFPSISIHTPLAPPAPVPSHLTSPLKHHALQLLCFFFLFSSSVQIGFRVYQVSIVMCNLLGQPNVAAAHKASNLAFSICPFEGLKRSDAKT